VIAESMLPCGSAIVDRAIQSALAGDPVTLRACLNKLVPTIRRRPIVLELPEDASPAELDGLLDAASHAVVEGIITTEEARDFAVFARARTEAREAALRLRRLEAEDAAAAAEQERQRRLEEDQAVRRAARDRAVAAMRAERDRRMEAMRAEHGGEAEPAAQLGYEGETEKGL
jgi:hypothetical protein